MITRGRALGLLLTLVFLGLALRSVDPSQLARQLQTINYVWLIPSALCTLVGYLLRTARWRVILGGTSRIPLTRLFPILVMGFATNNLVPGRLGEFWRAYMLGRKYGVRKTFALASVVVERVFDGLVLLLILGLVSRLIRLPGWGQQIELLSAVIFVGASAAIALLVLQPNFVHRLAEFVSRSLPPRPASWLLRLTTGFMDGLQVLRSPMVLVQAGLISAGVWLMEGASYVLLAQGISLGLAASQQLPALGLTLVTINLGIMLPSAPGYVGTQEFFGKTALGAFGVAEAPALALVAVSHAVQFLLVTGLGLVFFAREHVSPRQFQMMAPSETERVN